MKTKKNLFKFYVLTVAFALLFSTALAAAGTLDPTFGANGIVIADLGSNTDSGNDVALQADGRMFLLGFAQLNPDNLRERTTVITRYTGSGAVDTTFGAGGSIYPNTATFSGAKIAVQPDGKLIVAGSSNGNFAVVRYGSNGILDTTFGIGGMGVLDWDSESYQTLTDVALQSDGKIVLVGDYRISGSNFTDFIVARFAGNGMLDNAFVANGFLIIDNYNFPNNRYNYGKAVVIQPDGKIVISGDMMDNDGETQISLARLNTDGSFDTAAFGTNGKGTVTAALPNFSHRSGAIALQADGKIIVAGSIANEDLALARFNTNGALDITFGGTGIVVTDFWASEYGADIHLQADGKIVVVGTGSDSLLLVRYNSNGALDTTFGDNGKLLGEPGTSGAGVEIQSNGKILAAGSSNGDAALSRYDVIASVTTAFKSTGAYDGWILEYSEFSNTGGLFDKLATTFNLGDDQRDRQYRSILSFNTATLPDKAVVTSAQLRIKRQGLVGTDPFTTHGPLYLNISNRAFSANLALQLVDFNAAFTPGSTQDRVVAETFQWYKADLSQTNLAFISKVGVTQFRLRFSKDDNDDLGADYMKFFSGNSIDENMPQLIVTYYVP